MTKKMRYALASLVACANVASPATQPADSAQPPDRAAIIGSLLPGGILRFAPPTEAQKIVSELPPPGESSGGGFWPLAPDAPMPSADPRDFQGTWAHGQDLNPRNTHDMFGIRTPYTMAAARVMKRRVDAKTSGAPYRNASSQCLPPGQGFQLEINGPFQIFQSKDSLEFVFRQVHGHWNIALDPKLLPPENPKEYMGRSIAHWDGNTLVVETTDFKQDIWFDTDGTPLSKNGKLTFRIRKIDYGDRQPYLEMIITIQDPLYYTNPWSISRLFYWFPTRTLFAEYNCEEQVGDPSGITDAGLPPEPTD